MGSEVPAASDWAGGSRSGDREACLELRRPRRSTRARRARTAAAGPAAGGSAREEVTQKQPRDAEKPKYDHAEQGEGRRGGAVALGAPVDGDGGALIGHSWPPGGVAGRARQRMAGRRPARWAPRPNPGDRPVPRRQTRRRCGETPTRRPMSGQPHIGTAGGRAYVPGHGHPDRHRNAPRPRAHDPRRLPRLPGGAAAHPGFARHGRRISRLRILPVGAFGSASTAHYRLGWIEEKIGCDLRRLANVIDLLIAVRFADA